LAPDRSAEAAERVRQLRDQLPPEFDQHKEDLRRASERFAPDFARHLEDLRLKSERMFSKERKPEADDQ
jgi:hypothetical protein